MLTAEEKYTRKVLRRLRYVAEKVIDYRHIKMKSWLVHRAGEMSPHLQADGTPDPHGCGTSACFLGWAIGGDEKFRKLTGLRLKWIFLGYSPETSSGETGETDIARAMGISWAAFNHLFSPNRSGKKKHVLNRLAEVEKNPQASYFRGQA